MLFIRSNITINVLVNTIKYLIDDVKMPGCTVHWELDGASQGLLAKPARNKILKRTKVDIIYDVIFIPNRE